VRCLIEIEPLSRRSGLSFIMATFRTGQIG
jgi:hypothetical protein